MAKQNDPLRALRNGSQANQDPTTPTTNAENVTTGQDEFGGPTGFGTDDVAVQSEIAKLTEKLTILGTIMEKQSRIGGIARLGYAPEEQRLQQIWDMAYSMGLKSIFDKGLAFYTSKGNQLAKELELAAIRADEAAEAYIRVRKTCPDPITKELQDWQKNKSTNPLVNPNVQPTPAPAAIGLDDKEPVPDKPNKHAGQRTNPQAAIEAAINSSIK